MIEVNGLTKRYGDLVAVDNLSFRVERGQILGFLGPNGAGKTSTMRMITGFMPPTSGSVRVDGFDTVDDSMEVRRRIGYLPETPPLYPDMTVTGYLRFVARLKGVRRSDVPAAVERTTAVCGLRDVGNRLTGHLSKGYRQRVGLAQALIHDPQVLVLDEPTIGLDPRQIIDIRKLIRTLGGQRTIILSTHILPEVAQVCERVVIINDGTIAEEGMLADLTQRRSLEQVFLDAVSREVGDGRSGEPAARTDA
jgi:ABC-2 type transport system ATP-binding protein